MKLIFYFCCRTEDCTEPYEEDWCMRWSSVGPQLGADVSMGAAERWRVVKITTYRSETAQDVDCVYVAHVHPSGLPVPPDSEWDSDPEIEPVQSIYAEVAAVGQEELTMGMMGGMKTPKIGEQIESIMEPTEEGPIIHEVPKLWARRRVVSYLPVSEMRLTTSKETTYARAFVCWCEATETVSEP